MFPFGRSLALGPISVRRLEVENGDAELARAVLASAWSKLTQETREKLARLDGDLEIPWGTASSNAENAEQAVHELGAKVAAIIETWTDEVLVGQLYRRQKNGKTRWAPELLVAVVEELATRQPHAIARLEDVERSAIERRQRESARTPPAGLLATAARVLERGRAPVLDVLEAKALEMQGLSPEASIQAIDHFDATGARFFAGSEYGFQFGTPERQIYGLESGLPPSPSGFLGPGIYFGTTPTPGWFLKHMGFVGWGIGATPARMPINLDKHRAYVRYSMFGSLPKEEERKLRVEYRRIRFNPLVPQAGVIAVDHHLKLV